MSTLYWITVIGKIYIIAQAALICFLTVSCITGIICAANNKEELPSLFKALRISCIATVISLLIVLFTPSTKELYAIYGVGTVIDYAKENKEVQKLPNNAVKALNVWLENVNKDKKDSTNNY